MKTPVRYIKSKATLVEIIIGLDVSEIVLEEKADCVDSLFFKGLSIIVLLWKIGSCFIETIGLFDCGKFINGITTEANTINNSTNRLILKRVSFRIMKRKDRYRRLRTSVDLSRNNNQLFISLFFCEIQPDELVPEFLLLKSSVLQQT